jgi:hypothetical protein
VAVAAGIALLLLGLLFTPNNFLSGGGGESPLLDPAKMSSVSPSLFPLPFGLLLAAAVMARWTSSISSSVASSDAGTDDDDDAADADDLLDDDLSAAAKSPIILSLQCRADSSILPARVSLRRPIVPAW